MIPKRGEKDFEPHATALQSNTLAASRQAMHNVLSYERVHQPKGHTIGTYHPETNMCYAMDPKGPLFMKMGRVLPRHACPFGDDELRGVRTWLHPEEALYLLERGTMDVRWPVKEGDEGELGLPMSLQAGYAMFLGDDETHDGALTFERFSVYSGLKRAGYTVLRAPSWNSAGPELIADCYPPAPKRRTWQTGLFDSFSALKNFFGEDPRKLESQQHAQQAEGPIISNDLYRNYMDIYRRLALINFHDPTLTKAPTTPELPTTDPGFRITYHVWKPGSAHFKKSAPVNPDFRIAVVNARESEMPTLEQLGALLETSPYDPPPKPDAHMHMKLKHGYKNVILAIVDQGVPSYLRIADAAFGLEKVYERNQGSRGGKKGGRGGRGGGRGRGRGRGR